MPQVIALSKILFMGVENCQLTRKKSFPMKGRLGIRRDITQEHMLGVGEMGKGPKGANSQFKAITGTCCAAW